MNRALVSTTDKTGLIDFVSSLVDIGWEIIATSGTAEFLREGGIPVRTVEEEFGVSSLLGGRVKTLDWKLFSCILYRGEEDISELEKHGVKPFSLVVVNLYAFERKVKGGASIEEAVEHIDIGGVSLIRAAAKNFFYVGCVSDPSQYPVVLNELKTSGRLSFPTRLWLAREAFARVSAYDAGIREFLDREMASEKSSFPSFTTVYLKKVRDLRYGENPHQPAALYHTGMGKSIADAIQLQGKDLSFNNILDADSALSCVLSFDEPACVIVKHTSPCGVGIGETASEAFQRAYDGDSLSAFGGIVALNRVCDSTTAELMGEIFLEVVIAPGFTEEALGILRKKKNLRLLSVSWIQDYTPLPWWEVRGIRGGVLMQEADWRADDEEEWEVVSDRLPTDEEWLAMRFAWKVVRFVKSNAIVLANRYQTVGIGMGQASRVDAVRLAVQKMGGRNEGVVMASDAFFPFRDAIDVAADAGIFAVIQPGGSIRDEEVKQAVREHNMAMVFTGKRHFRH